MLKFSFCQVDRYKEFSGVYSRLDFFHKIDFELLKIIFEILMILEYLPSLTAET